MTLFGHRRYREIPGILVLESTECFKTSFFFKKQCFGLKKCIILNHILQLVGFFALD